jgi:hypothetical protein
MHETNDLNGDLRSYAKLPVLQGELLRDVYGNYVALDQG